MTIAIMEIFGVSPGWVWSCHMWEENSSLDINVNYTELNEDTLLSIFKQAVDWLFLLYPANFSTKFLFFPFIPLFLFLYRVVRCSPAGKNGCHIFLIMHWTSNIFKLFVVLENKLMHFECRCMLSHTLPALQVTSNLISVKWLQ